MMVWCAAQGARDFDRALAVASRFDKIAAMELCVAWGATDLEPAKCPGKFTEASAEASAETWLGKVIAGELAVERQELPGAADFNVALCAAARHGEREAMAWCAAHGAADFGAALASAAEGGQVGAMKWCVARGARAFDRALQRAAKRGLVDTMKLCIAWGAADLKAAQHSAKGSLQSKGAEAWLGKVVAGKLAVGRQDPEVVRDSSD